MYRLFSTPNKMILVFSTVLILLICLFNFVQPSYTQSDLPPRQVVVKLKPDIQIDMILNRYSASLLDVITETNLYFLELPEHQTAEELLPTLNADPDLYYAEPNYYAEAAPDGSVILFRAHMAPLANVILFRAHGNLDPAPPEGPEQWAWEKVRLTEAKKVSQGQGIIVAVLDTGLAADHPLLNSSLTAGYDFVGMTDEIYDTGNNLDDDGDGLVDEDFGHGTHVSGIIVTTAPDVQIMPIRVLNSDGVGTYWEVAAGIRFAVDHGAKIINLSMSAPRLTPSLAEALDYAAAHDVLVIAAAGSGTDANYPAAYQEQDIIGVGATDLNDEVVWFSGGQPGDTDIYAPGVDIYSAFPYGDYVLGSGTSMAAPVVAGEAAQLMARYPEWSLAQIIERIRTQTVSVPGASVGRVDLAAAIDTGLQIAYRVGDLNSPNDNHIKPNLQIINNSPEDIPLSEVKIRYWYTNESQRPQTFACDYVPFGCAHVTADFIALPSTDSRYTASSDTCVEIGFLAEAGDFAAGAAFDLYSRIHKDDWSVYDETNDYSYKADAQSFMAWQNITIYRNGALAWGTEPGGNGSTSSPTATPLPTTATPAPTSTSAATTTPTALPPTATAPAVTSAQLHYMPGNTETSGTNLAPRLILFNTGTTSISLNEMQIRYWYTTEGAVPQNYWCDYASLGCDKITAQFVELSTPLTGANTYLEIGFTAAAGELLPNADTGQIHSRITNDDWSNYVQTGDHSFGAEQTQFEPWTQITVYQNGVLTWGTEPQ
jgi:hypothetical protein